MELIIECPNCGSSRIKPRFRVGDRHYGIEGKFDLSQCDECKLVFLNPMFNDTELAKFYPEDSYYSYYMDYDGNKPKLTQKLYEYISLDKFTKPRIEEGNGRKILDIGCGNGWTLYQYRKKGWSVAGVEPSKIACEIGNSKGLNIAQGALSDIGYNDNEFDFIRSNHSFEHIYNPNETLKEIYRILKPNGKLLIGIPNYGGLNSKLAKQYWYYLGAPVHTFNFSVNNISQLLNKHGFKVSDVKYVSNYCGVLGTLQVYFNRNTKLKSYEGKLINNTYLRVFSEWIAKLENLLRIGDCIEVTAEKKF